MKHAGENVRTLSAFSGQLVSFLRLPVNWTLILVNIVGRHIDYVIIGTTQPACVASPSAGFTVTLCISDLLCVLKLSRMP